jgi:hypothetical protein
MIDVDAVDERNDTTSDEGTLWIAREALDLDHLSAELGENGTRGRGESPLRHFDDADTLEHLRHATLPDSMMVRVPTPSRQPAMLEAASDIAVP